MLSTVSQKLVDNAELLADLSFTIGGTRRQRRIVQPQDGTCPGKSDATRKFVRDVGVNMMLDDNVHKVITPAVSSPPNSPAT
ncbi:hypothetical protein LshimejAT787_0506250 [Lyophyllum shimeji]|uniref:Uncharacterized protein n=1 Tax=Lyophyllum shimeji TaxID=47721 RepID=A0A9P3PLX3_LYOSH|nr:hypothetical protein LshimejAT787_0506250 [Lyophyllum shimeji]